MAEIPQEFWQELVKQLLKQPIGIVISTLVLLAIVIKGPEYLNTILTHIRENRRIKAEIARESKKLQSEISAKLLQKGHKRRR